MARAFGVQKVDLRLVLALVALGKHPSAGSIVSDLGDAFKCSERAVWDALAILRRSRLVEAQSDGIDRRRHRYAITERGEQVLTDPSGGLLLRVARKRHTTCPPKARRGSRDRRRGDADTVDSLRPGGTIT